MNISFALLEQNLAYTDLMADWKGGLEVVQFAEFPALQFPERGHLLVLMVPQRLPSFCPRALCNYPSLGMKVKESVHIYWIVVYSGVQGLDNLFSIVKGFNPSLK